MKKVIIQFLKFAVVGGLSFLIDAGIYLVLVKLFGETYHLIFNVIGFSVSVLFNYACSMRFVFKGKENLSRAAEMTIFIILSIIGLGINELAMWVMVDKMGIEALVSGILSGHLTPDSIQTLSGLCAKIIATFIVTVWNFISRKIFLEEKEPKAA